MKMPRYFILTALCLLAGCSDKSTKTAATTNAPPGSNPLNAPADYVGALDKGRRSAISTVDIAQVTQAVQMFNANEGRYPKDLNELIEAKLLIKVPDVPSGMKLDYDPNTGAVKVVRVQ